VSPDRAWKASERGIARLLNGRRVPVTGRGRGDVADVEHAWLSIEVKCRRTVPAWLLIALAQARAAARDGRLPVAIIHRHGARHADDLVVIRLADFRDHFGDLPSDGPAPDA
jgi:hypothetical protein